jgi:hypothetical protein
MLDTFTGKIYRVVTLAREETEEPIILDTYTEDDAEEVGAALATAGFHSQVWDFDQLLHEFFPR